MQTHLGYFWRGRLLELSHYHARLPCTGNMHLISHEMEIWRRDAKMDDASEVRFQPFSFTLRASEIAPCLRWAQTRHPTERGNQGESPTRLGWWSGDPLFESWSLAQRAPSTRSFCVSTNI